jgi:branched-chain amino acid transport system substrate-binding protein
MTVKIWRRRAWLALAVAVLLAAGAGRKPAFAAAAGAPAISDGVVRIGLILDMSGPFAQVTGKGSATAARMAVEDFGGRVLGAPIEVLVADHKANPDRAANIARDWFENRHVDAIMDVSGSSPALVVQAIANTEHKIVVLNAPGARRLSGEACTPTSIHYVFNTTAIANTIASELLSRGERTWFFITADYSFGYDLARDTAAIVESQGGTVVGEARHPLGALDFTSYLSRARTSGATVIALANSGADLAGTIADAARLGMIPGRQTIAALDLRINTVHALGLKTTQGMMLAKAFYWDMDDATRQWSKRFFDRMKEMPNSLQAGVYSSTIHYLQAIAHAGTDATDPVLAAMREMPINDFFARNGHIRADGLMVHNMYLFQVKAPAESHHPWDYFNLIATVSGADAFGPPAQSQCPLARAEPQAKSGGHR